MCETCFPAMSQHPCVKATIFVQVIGFGTYAAQTPELSGCMSDAILTVLTLEDGMIPLHHHDVTRKHQCTLPMIDFGFPADL